MTTNTSEPTPPRPKPPHRPTRLLLAILVAVAVPLITVAVIWPSFGAACAITVGLLISVLQNIRDHHRPNDHPRS
jgi:hypothetical protein